MENKTPHRGYLSTVISCRCPRCREGKLFKHPLTLSFRKNMQMNERCPVCGQPTEIEIGFYYGTGYVSYVIALLLSGVSFIIWLLTIGFSFSDKRFLYWVVCNSILLVSLQPWLMRFARSLWLSWFVSYDADWKIHELEEPERIVKEQMNNW